MNALNLVLYLLGAVCFLVGSFGIVAGYGTAERRRTVNLVALGLFFWILVPLITEIKK